MIKVSAAAESRGRTMDDVRNDCVLIAMHVLSAAGFSHTHDFDGGFRDIPKGHKASLADSLKFLLENILIGIMLKELAFVRWLAPSQAQKISAMEIEFRKYMAETIAYGRAVSQGGGKSDRADIASSLIHADEAARREQDNEKTLKGSKMLQMTDEELFGNLYIINLAGFETTANALTYTFPYLAVNKAVQDWVGDEVDTVLKGRDLNDLDYEEVYPKLVRCLALMVCVGVLACDRSANTCAV
jgi:cytochrome P450